jgi:regulator of sirC expression with transglutaminase-like and TPR domain
MYDTSVQVIGDLRAGAPADLQGTYAYFLGEAHRRRDEPGDAARARALYAEAIGLPGAPPDAWREHGLALRDQGDPAGARAALARYLELAPDADDAAFVRRDLDQLEATP